MKTSLNKPIAKIDNWYYDKFRKLLVGKVTEHPNQDQFFQEIQQTSKVIRFEPLFNLAETKHTLYVLGSPRIEKL